MEARRTVVACLGLAALCSGASAATLTGPLTFVGITPCRIVDTRTGFGFSGFFGSARVGGEYRPDVPDHRNDHRHADAVRCPGHRGRHFSELHRNCLSRSGRPAGVPGRDRGPRGVDHQLQAGEHCRATTVPLGPTGGGHSGIVVHADVTGTDFLADVNGYYIPAGSLPSGQTLRGTYAIEANASGAGVRAISPISFPRELAAAPAADFIAVGGAPTTNCPALLQPNGVARVPLRLRELRGERRLSLCREYRHCLHLQRRRCVRRRVLHHLDGGRPAQQRGNLGGDRSLIRRAGSRRHKPLPGSLVSSRRTVRMHCRGRASGPLRSRGVSTPRGVKAGDLFLSGPSEPKPR